MSDGAPAAGLVPYPPSPYGLAAVGGTPIPKLGASPQTPDGASPRTPYATSGRMSSNAGRAEMCGRAAHSAPPAFEAREVGGPPGRSLGEGGVGNKPRAAAPAPRTPVPHRPGARHPLGVVA